MDSRDRRVREIQQSIREVLLRRWDPVGIKDVPEAQDEYDSYVGRIYPLLARRASEDEVVEHLRNIDPTGELPEDPGVLRPVARQLLALKASL